jgi:hypothetical protein
VVIGNASNVLAYVIKVLIPSAINADCKLIASQWQAMPVQSVFDAVLLQYAMCYGLFVVGHHTTFKPFVVSSLTCRLVR